MNVVAKKNFNWKTSFVGTREAEWYWAKQPSGSISLPDFIQLRAKGEAKMADGHVYLKKPGSDPELHALLNERMLDTQKRMADAMTKNLYDDSGKALTLMLLLGKPKKSRNGVTGSSHRHWQRNVVEGTRPRSPETRRRFEIIAGPHGNLLSYQKLKELCPDMNYEKPR
jgi:hypothetical protein